LAEGAGAGGQRSDLGGLIDEGAGFRAVRDVGAVEGVLQERERGAGRDEYGDVAGFRGAPGFRAVVVHQPAVAEGLLDDGGDVGGFAFAEDGGLRARQVVVRHGAENGDGETGRRVLVRRWFFERYVAGVAAPAEWEDGREIA